MTWDELTHPWQCCLEDAWTAYCGGSTGHPIGAAVTDAPVVPRGVQLGTMLFESGDLRRMRDDGMSAAGVFDQLVSRVHAV